MMIVIYLVAVILVAATPPSSGTLTSGRVTCPSCERDRQVERVRTVRGNDAIDLIRTEMIKEDILSKLHMTTRPKKRTDQPKIPEAVMRNLMGAGSPEELDPRQEEHEHDYEMTDDFFGITDQVLIIAKRIKNCKSFKPMRCLRFELPKHIRSEQILSAKLWLYKAKTTKSDTPPSLSKSVYNVYEVNTPSKRRTRMATSVPTSRRTRQWLEIDVTDHVTSWFRSSHVTRSKRLDVTCPTCWRRRNNTPYARRSDRIRPILEVAEDTTPMIAIQISQKKRKGRPRRQVCGEEGCCKKDFILDFEELGWSDWVIRPKRVNIKQCHGKCQVLQQMSLDKITRSATMLFFTTEVLQSIAPCCSASKMSSLRMVFSDHYGMIRSMNIPNLIVDKCKCTF